MNDITSIEQAKRAILQANYIVVVTHSNPDGDAIGSSVALRNLCLTLGKKAFLILDSDIPDNLKFLDFQDDILVYDKSRDSLHFQSADLIVILDLNDSKRLKKLEAPVMSSSAYKIVIDHHTDPKKFADFYIVDTDSPATGLLIKNLYSYFPELIIDKNSATALYTAILTDTGSFRYPRTTAKTHIHIADLIKCGADPVEIYDKVYNSNSLSATKLLGEALAKMTIYLDGRLCIMAITQDMFDKTGAKNDDIGFFVERTLAIKGVQVGIMISNIPGTGEIRVSLRSKGDFSVRDIAAVFGGGGHLNASGARFFDKTLDEAKSLIIEEVAKRID